MYCRGRYRSSICIMTARQGIRHCQRQYNKTIPMLLIVNIGIFF
nr:MAG TPA: hypothetical protein [Caudoviricetes sp.]